MTWLKTNKHMAIGLALLIPALALTLAAAGPNTLWGDRAVLEGVQDHLPRWLEPATAATNFLGYFERMAVVALLVGTALWIKRRPRDGFLVVISLSGWWANSILKALAESPRPPAELATGTATGWGFPSGHVMGITVVVAVMAYVLARDASPRVQLTAALAVAVTAIITGLGRMHVGVHWPSDVLGAWLWATIWFLALVAAFRALTSTRPAASNGASGRITRGQ